MQYIHFTGYILVSFHIVLGGIYTGFFTPTEAAVVGGYVNTGQDCTAATRIYVDLEPVAGLLEGLGIAGQTLVPGAREAVRHHHARTGATRLRTV